jgi:hypothetical protein
MITESQDSPIGIAMGYRLDSQGSIPGKGKSFLFSIKFGRVVGPIQPPIQYVAGEKRQEREADHSLPPSAEVKSDAPNFRPTCSVPKFKHSGTTAPKSYYMLRIK